MSAFENAIETVGSAIEGAGVAVIVIGGVAATVGFLARVRGAGGFESAYRSYRLGLGRALLLGLEFLVAGDIIRTVSTNPTLTDVAVLAGIVLIRTFLSVALEVETEGRWPWQARGDSSGTSRRRPADAAEPHPSAE